jgi:chemotaxis protein MotB
MGRRKYAKRNKHADSHADERWLRTYADMITLLLALFIILYSISMVNVAKFKVVASTMRNAFHNSGKQVVTQHPAIIVFPPKHDPTKTKHSNAEDLQLAALKRCVDAAIAREGLRGSVSTGITRRGLVIGMRTDRVLFDVGSDQVSPKAGALLRRIAPIINSVPNALRVEGRTDKLPFRGDPYGNWRLSSDRATSVLAVLLESGYQRSQHNDIEASAFADTRPIAPTAPDGASPANRRVEVVLLRQHQLLTITP